ncbi:MAG: hypothetical protein ACYTE5_09065 [Planctomycetota bacterium]
MPTKIKLMNKRSVIFIKIFLYSALIITVSCLLYFDENRIETLTVQHWLKQGTPGQKEAILNLFMKQHSRRWVPAVIKAILDDTPLPRHGDTGWGRVYHQAATAMCKFAQSIDGKTQRERGLDEYSFFRDGGVASLRRRKEVHRNWKQWWHKNKSRATRRSSRLPRTPRR